MRNPLLLAILLGSALTGVPALAQNARAGSGSYQIQKGHLDDASKIYTAPLRLEVVDIRPLVSDRRHSDVPTVYEISIPPLPNAQAGNTQRNLKPGVVRITANQDGRILAAPGFQSNIPVGGSTVPRNLSSGVTTGVHAALNTPPAPEMKRRMLLGPNTITSAPRPVTAKYQFPSIQGSSATQVSTSVKAEISKRGQLLHH